MAFGGTISPSSNKCILKLPSYATRHVGERSIKNSKEKVL